MVRGGAASVEPRERRRLTNRLTYNRSLERARARERDREFLLQYTSLAATRCPRLSFFLSALTPRRSTCDSALSRAALLRFAIALRTVGARFRPTGAERAAEGRRARGP